MADYKEGIKKEVAEVKFLIHDLRVERFINEIIHFHVTLNTDLEIYSIEQAQILHAEDLQVLKEKAVSLRKALRDYSNAVKNFSPDRTVLLKGQHYINTIYGTCELILNPLWGRIDNVMGFLPDDSRSARSLKHYENCIRWIGGVHNRIKHFLDEIEHKDLYEEFDVGAEIEDFTRNVVEGYVNEKSGSTVDLRLGALESAAVGGNRYRFRRMYFNLVMNAVDAMSNRKDGVLDVTSTVEAGHVVLRMRDNGVGMTPEKTRQLLTDRETLDGELHSLGFVFVRQTIAEFKGDVAIESEVGKGTTVTVRLPGLGREGKAREERKGSEASGDLERVAPARGAAPPARAAREAGKSNRCGGMIYEDYRKSDAPYPGSIFAISVTEDDRIDFFTHRAYERHWNITHEDLSPMLFLATVRGRLEEDEEKRPVLTLVAPHNVRDYFEFKGVPEPERSPERHVQMLRDEYVRIARKLIDTGLPPETGVRVSELRKCFPEQDELLKREPFPLELLARQVLTAEGRG